MGGIFHNPETGVLINAPAFLSSVAVVLRQVLHSSHHVLCHFSCVQLFVTTKILPHLAPLSIGFSRQENCCG